MSVEGWPTSAQYAATGTMTLELSTADARAMAELAIKANPVSAQLARALLREIDRHTLSPEHVGAFMAFASSSHAAQYHPFTVAAIRAVLATQERP